MSIYFTLTGGAQEYFRGEKRIYYNDTALQYKHFGVNTTQDFYINKSHIYMFSCSYLSSTLKTLKW